jgi:MoaA/NifB/PqqE/SkfB family radical SAM enzyme
VGDRRVKPGAAAYSDLKAAWHLHGIESLRLKQRFSPPHVQLILSDLCNQDCHFCAYRMSGGFSSENFAEDGNKNPNRKIPTEKALEILNDCAALGVAAIQFTGGGEPTVHPEHMAIFCHALDLQMQCGLVTNGTRLMDGWREVLPRFSWIRVSLDAGRSETYAAIRSAKPETFHKVLRHVSMIAEKCPDTVLGVGFVVTPENWTEIGLAAKLSEESGARYIRISAMFSKDFAKPFDAIYDKTKEEISRAVLQSASPTFEVLNLFGERLSDLVQHAPDYPICGYQHFNVYVGGDLKVYRCCNTAYTTHGEVGNLKNQTFREWFQSSGANYFNFDARSCSVCQFNNKNRIINYLVDENPVHVNFV